MIARVAISAALCFGVASCSSGSSHSTASAGAGGGIAMGGTGGHTGGANSGGSNSAGTNSGGSSGAGTGGAGGASGQTLAARYPGDVGIEKDSAVVWVENFEEGSVGAVTARYDSFQNAAGMTLSSDVPTKSSGSKSMQLVSSGTGANATDLYKNLATGYEEWFVRYYAKYQAGVQWHHTGVWVGGYNPPSKWPNPQAGLKPNGDDRFSISYEPMEAASNPRMDFYNYWMMMHSWMDVPSGNTAYYGNSLVHQTRSHAVDDAWMCVEIHVKLNPDPASGAGAQLGLWVDDTSFQQFSDAAPLGYWIKDKFCPAGADGTECTDYPPAAGTQMVPLDLRYRSTTALKLTAFWPQNYITSGGDGAVWYDDMVIATERVGCLR